jgi:SpoVK/Ycf46/Vps4 family AAA+-type ATPase
MIDPKTYVRLHGRDDRVEDKGDLPESAFESDTPPEDPFVLLLPPTMKGFKMHDKKWVDLDVARVSDVTWNTQAFKSLVADAETKDLIEALVRNKLETQQATDLIDGKGNGLIILLHGGPGTGKTFTAESVAEIAQKPLYRVTCGDIGTTPKRVEEYLESVLYLGRLWGCVVLLDEADVFLEERTLTDLQRNALVSVFLRVLEYYSGMLCWLRIQAVGLLTS